MANADPTGILGAVAGLAAVKVVSLVQEQLHYKDGCEELLNYLSVLEPLLCDFRMDSNAVLAIQEFHSSLVNWTKKTRQVCDLCEVKTCFCHFKRRKVFKQIGDQLKQLDCIQKEANLLKVYYGAIKPSPIKAMLLLQPVPPESQVIGMKERFEALSENLLGTVEHDHGCSEKWLGVSAMGGAGKTLLAQTTFNDPLVAGHFQERFWITVSQERKVENLQEELLMQIEKREWKVRDRRDGRTWLCNLLQGRRVLLVLDDVWKYSVLQWFDVVQETQGSKILITTRNHEVLSYVKALQVPFDLLTERQSWQLFCINAFHRKEVSDLPEMVMRTAQEIAKQCKGLPLALQVIGKAMASKREEWQWQRMLEKLKKASQISTEEEEHLFDVLKVSYEELENIDEHGYMYQECFLDMAAFPEDEEVPVKELVRIWKGLAGSEGDAYEIAQQLENRCLVEVKFKDSAFPLLPMTKHYKIHDVLRDLALRLLGKDKGCFYVAGSGMTQHEFETIASRYDASSLRKVSLEGNQITDLSPIDSKAPHMEMLLLDNIKSLSGISNSLCDNFSNLQVLSLKNVSIKEWPENVGTLKNLRVLEAFGAGYSGQIRLGNISGLTKLEFLHTNYSIGSNCQFLGSFTSLTHLSIEEYFISVPHEALTKLVHLKTLDVNLKNVSDITQALYAFTRLEVLRLWYRGEETLPFWNGVFQRSVHLEFLCLRNANKVQPPISLEDIPAMLPRLKVLYLNNAYLQSLPRTFGEVGAFPQLRQVDLKCKRLSSLPDLVAGALPLLSKLSILNSHKITSLPHSWTILTNLEILELSHCRGLSKILCQESGLSSFHKLRAVDLQSTSVSTLPQALLTLPQLRFIDVRGCRRLLELSIPSSNSFPSHSKVCVAHSGLSAEELRNNLRRSGLRIHDTLACAPEHKYTVSHN